ADAGSGGSFGRCPLVSPGRCHGAGVGVGDREGTPVTRRAAVPFLLLLWGAPAFQAPGTAPADAAEHPGDTQAGRLACAARIPSRGPQCADPPRAQDDRCSGEDGTRSEGFVLQPVIETLPRQHILILTKAAA